MSSLYLSIFLILLGFSSYGSSVRLNCEILNPASHAPFQPADQIRVEEKGKGSFSLVEERDGRDLKTSPGRMERAEGWIYGSWNNGQTWLSLGLGKTSNRPDSHWVGAIVFKSQYDFRVACHDPLKTASKNKSD